MSTDLLSTQTGKNPMWIQDNSHTWITPGGDPVWICSVCGGGRQFYTHVK